MHDLNTVLVAVSATVVVAGCRPTNPLEWHPEDGYRWAQLHVPRRGTDGFRQLDPSRTGITFTNVVSNEQAMQNEHLFNGSGVTIGDVDGDELADVYLTRMEGANVLYRNLGGWRFEDVTAASGVGLDGALSTGAVFADIDGDRDLDLMVTSLGGEHSVLLNDGTGRFSRPTQSAGLASGFYGTTMTLADVDDDGDLDLYTANNKVRTVRDIYPPQEIDFDRVVQQVDTGWVIREGFREHYVVERQPGRLMRLELAEPDKFYLNDGTGRFEEVAFDSGAFLDEAGVPLMQAPRDWGLAARFYDLDRDGDPDLYVCNDFETPDRIWINDGTGRFQAIKHLAVRTTSNATMAVDFADADRDGDIDFLEVDMLDRDRRMQKTQVSPNAPGPTVIGEIDDRPQLGRNTFFINRGDLTFAEAAYYAGLEASGWSWATIFLDVDLDGYEDLLIANGHQHDFLDADTQMRIQAAGSSPDWRQMRFLYPKLHLHNVAFHNNGDLTFRERGREWGFGRDADVTHGMAAGDLDGDGDLDLVANRLGLPAAVYRNEGTAPRVAVRLRGEAPNTQGVGSKIRVHGGPVEVQEKEVTLGGIYLSSAEPMYAFATGDAELVDIVVEWRSGRWSVLEDVAPNHIYEVSEADASGIEELPDVFRPGGVTRDPPVFTDVSDQLGHRHVERDYNDFARQPLLPNRLSQLGPGVTWYDVDRDGDEDLLVGSGATGTLGFYRNHRGRLVRVSVPLQSPNLDLTTVLAVPSGSTGSALLVGQMNYEARTPQSARGAASVLRVEMSSTEPPRVVSSGIDGHASSTGPMALADYDQDGDLDLFVGGRALPARYPAPATSRLFRNDDGFFTLDESNRAVLTEVGLVSSAVFSDIDGDGDPDLLLAIEWGSPTVLINEGGVYHNATESYGLTAWRSRWNGITTGDLNGDGMLDIIATSWGRNTKLAATPQHPMRAYYGDVDGDGRFDLVLARYDERLGDMAPLQSRGALLRGIPLVGRGSHGFHAFADATLQDLLGPALARASILDVTTFDHMLFLNRGETFDARPLPREAQLAPAFYAGVLDLDGDGFEDLFLTQNFYPTELEMSRYAAGRGLWLRGNGTGELFAVDGSVSGIKVYGDQRGAAFSDFNSDGRVDLAVSQNANETKLYRNDLAKPGVRVRLLGPPDNPHGMGAMMRLVFGQARGPGREVHAGSGYWSHNGAVQVLGFTNQPSAVWVRWPDGTETITTLEPGMLEVAVPYGGGS